MGKDSAGNVQEYARIRSFIADNTSALEDGVLQLLAMVNGSLAEVATIGPGIQSAHPLGGIGYSPGAGGAAVQATSKSTTVALDKVSGTITLNGAALAANTNVSFTWTNAAIDAGDRFSWQHESGGTIGAYAINAIAGAGSATVTVRNITGGSLSEAPVFGFTVLKGSNS